MKELTYTTSVFLTVGHLLLCALSFIWLRCLLLETPVHYRPKQTVQPLKQLLEQNTKTISIVPCFQNDNKTIVVQLQRK